MKDLTWCAKAVGILVLGMASHASAQRREGKSSGEALELKLTSAVKFGEVIVAPRRYRVNVTTSGLALVNPSSMVTVATLPVQETTSKTSADTPTIRVRETKTSVEVVVKIRDQIYRARGDIVEAALEGESKVILAKNTEADLGQVTPAQKTERELIGRALKRYHSQVKHCADKVKRSRWRTDDRRFHRCLCPLAVKWRLPKVKEPMRVHADLAKGRSGYSLTVSRAGRVDDCRVWVGPKPPKDEPADGSVVVKEAQPSGEAASAPEGTTP